MTTSVRFEADEGWSEFRLGSYEFPEMKTGSDANWIIGEVALGTGDQPQQVATQSVYFRTDELDELLRDLKAMLAGDTEQISTAHIEEQFGISIRRDGGRFDIEVWISDHEKRESVEGLIIDRAGIEATLLQLGKAAEKFPIKGDPYGTRD